MCSTIAAPPVASGDEMLNRHKDDPSTAALSSSGKIRKGSDLALEGEKIESIPGVNAAEGKRGITRR